MHNPHHATTKIAFLSVSLVLTSAYAIQGALPQLKAALNLSQQQAEYLVTTPSIAVMVMVVLSPLLQNWFHCSDKQMIMVGVSLLGLAGAVPLFTASYPLIISSRLVLGAGIGLYNSQAISILTHWYRGSEQAMMIGWHAAAEQIGQALTVWLASLLFFSFGWHAPFAVYLLALAILFFFAFKVPDDHQHQEPLRHQAADQEVLAAPQKISPAVFLLAFLAFLLVIDYVGMENRFASLAAAFQASHRVPLFLAMMLGGATIGGLCYGWLYDRLGFATVYLGLGLMALANFFFSLASHHFFFAVAGLLLIGFPYQLLSPLVFNLLPTLAPANRQTTATAICLVGFNLGAFFSPTIGAWANQLIGQPLSDSGLAAPFALYGGVLVIIAVIIYLVSHRYSW